MSVITFCADIARTSLVYCCTARGNNYLSPAALEFTHRMLSSQWPDCVRIKRRSAVHFCCGYAQRTFLNVLPMVYLRVYLITIHYEGSGGMLSVTFHVMLWVIASNQLTNQPCCIEKSEQLDQLCDAHISSSHLIAHYFDPNLKCTFRVAQCVV